MVVVLRITIALVLSAAAASAQSGRVRAWVDNATQKVNEPFHIHIEASGSRLGRLSVPDTPGLTLRAPQTSRSMSIIGGSAKQELTVSYVAIAQRPGTLTFPRVAIDIDGKERKTEPIEITVLGAATQPQTESQEELSTKDLVFTRMFVDSEEVYQGEPILLTMELWRIDNRSIDSGSYRGANIRFPSTEGFYEASLDPVGRRANLRDLPYNVNADRRLLFPTTIGPLTIGAWHWEGLARWPSQNRRSRIFHEEHRYALDEGPITIKVKPLPKRPPNFSGAVGQFDLTATISKVSLLQGVPIKLDVRVSGSGNPDAIGEPLVPALDWAHLSNPQRNTESSIVRSGATLQIVKHFEYTLTPLKPGEQEIGMIDFTYFDPDQEDFITKTAGPFSLDVLASVESPQRLIVGADVGLGAESVSILGEDIHPIIRSTEPLATLRPSPNIAPLLFFAPFLLYLFLFVFSHRQRRFSSDRGFARAYHAKTKALKRLTEIIQGPEATDQLYRAVTAYLGDIFNVEEAGMTSADAEILLRDQNIEAAITQNFVKLLRSCERAHYGGHALSHSEVDALVNAAKTGVNVLSDRVRKGVPS